MSKKRLAKLNNLQCAFPHYQTALNRAKQEYPCIKTINYCCGCCENRETECCWKNYQKVDLSKILNPFGRTQDGMCCICLWWTYPNEHDCERLENERGYFSSCCWTKKGKKYQQEKAEFEPILRSQK